MIHRSHIDWHLTPWLPALQIGIPQDTEANVTLNSFSSSDCHHIWTVA